ncbi:ribosome biogenesis factor YjgA [Pleionea litopenaei]|uniref:Ribosome biogenesis factor YjgA n=1 Tax=Pleionea litopenaei TaxID=3070815 RepID=A0AA51RT26_9GAMM|nr:ribosome biogenesis factor YjgA [Pleionea sp. HL-JVS1]WMS87106.1 ribosome biogenesis factor YjgA [Pleionea sp. HL-JVS1]
MNDPYDLDQNPSEQANQSANTDDVRSKTQIKNELKEITEFGVELASMGLSIIKKLPLDEEIVEAFEEIDTVKGNEAKKRHFKRIGKLLRERELDDVRIALERIKLGKPLSTSAEPSLRDLWFDKLINQNENPEAFISAFPNSDRQKLRQLIRNAKKDPSKHAGKLKQYISSVQ